MRDKKYDEIHIENLQIFGKHGVFPEEKALPQKFLVSVTLYTDTRKAGKTDDLAFSVNYEDVSGFLERFLRENSYNLLETAAERASMALLKKFPGAFGLDMEIKKPWAPLGLPLDYVSVKITRFRHEAYIALGSNMGDKKAYLDFALARIKERDDCRVDRVSSYIVTKPYGYPDQDDFLNGCVKIETLLAPRELLKVLEHIEDEAGRRRSIRYGPRTLDLDILLYDDLVMDERDLTIPHREMHLRDFVLTPLAEIAPWAFHPVLGKTALQLKNDLTDKK